MIKTSLMVLILSFFLGDFSQVTAGSLGHPPRTYQDHGAQERYITKRADEVARYRSETFDTEGVPLHLLRLFSKFSQTQDPTLLHPEQFFATNGGGRSFLSPKKIAPGCVSCHSATITVGGEKRMIIGAPQNQDVIFHYHDMIYSEIFSVMESPQKFSEFRSFVFFNLFDHAEGDGALESFWENLKILAGLSEIKNFYTRPGSKEFFGQKRKAFSGMKRYYASLGVKSHEVRQWSVLGGVMKWRKPIVSDHMSTWEVHDDPFFKWDGMGSGGAEFGDLSAAYFQTANMHAVDMGVARNAISVTWDLPSPGYPFAIDKEKAARGAKIYSANCAECHDHRKLFSPRDLGIVTNRMSAGDDPSVRSELRSMLSPTAKFLGRGSMKELVYKAEKTLVEAPSLKGVWATAPYLHNGSVPTIRHLLLPSEKRRLKGFFRGNVSYDESYLGFHWRTKEDPLASWQPVTTDLVLGNAWHEKESLDPKTGKELPENKIEDLIEFLKTL